MNIFYKPKTLLSDIINISKEDNHMKHNCTAGHLFALLTIVIWGTTFISTKILLKDFQPVEILFFRFVMGLAA